MKNVLAISLILISVLVLMPILVGCNPTAYPVEIIRILKSRGAPPTGGWALPFSEVHPYPTGVQEINNPGEKMFLGPRLGQRLKSRVTFSKYTFFNKATGTGTEIGMLLEDLGPFKLGAILDIAMQYPWPVPSEPGTYELRVYLEEKIVASANGYTAAPIQMSITINGLAQGETATLLIGPETPDLDVKNALFEYPIIGTGVSIKKDIAPVLEDGYYLLMLEVPSQYFRDPKGYFFSVRDSAIINPMGKTITFNLKPQPTYRALEAVLSLAALPKQPISVTAPVSPNQTNTLVTAPESPSQPSTLQRVFIEIVIAIIVIALVVIAIRRLRSRVDHKI